MPKRSAVNAALDALTSDSGSGEDDAAAVAAADGPAPVSKVNVAALHRAGYEAGPSVLFVPEQKDRSAPESWEWSNGRGSAGQQAGPTPQEREEMRRITTVAVAESAAHARRAIEHSARLQDAKRDEKAERAKKKNFTWKEKEKRKRDAGMQSSSKNYVEEEKRRAREAGVYSGFDT